MSIAQNHKTTTLTPDRATTDPPAPAPADPLAQAEALLAKFYAGGWFLSRSATGSTADNRMALQAGLKIAELRQAKAQHVELVAVLSRIAAALEKGS